MLKKNNFITVLCLCIIFFVSHAPLSKTGKIFPSLQKLQKYAININILPSTLFTELSSETMPSF